MNSVKNKIMIPVLLLAVIAVATSILSIMNADSISKKGNDIANNYLVTIENVGYLSESTQKLTRSAYSYIVAEGDAAKKSVKDNIESLKSEIDGYMKDYEQTLDENEETAYSSYKNYYSQFLTQFAVLEKYVDTNQTVNASKLANNNLVDVCNSLESALDNMTNSEVEAADPCDETDACVIGICKDYGRCLSCSCNWCTHCGILGKYKKSCKSNSKN